MNEKCPNCGGPVYPHDLDSEMPVFVCPRCTYYVLKEYRKQVHEMVNKISELQKIISEGELISLPSMSNEPSFTLTISDLKIVFDGLCAFGYYCSDIDNQKLLSDVDDFTTRLGDWLDEEGIVFDD